MCTKCICSRSKLDTASAFQKLSIISVYIKEDPLTRGEKLGMFLDYLRADLKGNTTESNSAIQLTLDYKNAMEVRHPGYIGFYDGFYSLLRTMSENEIIRCRVDHYYKDVATIKGASLA
jgi:hypothetical protein